MKKIENKSIEQYQEHRPNSIIRINNSFVERTFVSIVDNLQDMVLKKSPGSAKSRVDVSKKIKY